MTREGMAIVHCIPRHKTDVESTGDECQLLYIDSRLYRRLSSADIILYSENNVVT